MMRLIAFTAIFSALTGTAIFACGPYYPYGEDVRFSIFVPEVFQPRGFYSYRFTAHSVMPDSEAEALGTEMNLKLWQKRAPEITDLEIIESAVYDDGKEGRNAFMSALYQKKDKTAYDYLAFAKECSAFNTFLDDPWERETAQNVPLRVQKIEQAIVKAGETTDELIKKRYVFLAIRLAFYDKNYEQVIKLYDTYFTDKTEKTIIDYWSMYFRAIAEDDKAKSNYYFARVFANAPDKRFVIRTYFNPEVKVEKALAFAATDEEKSAVWALYGFMSTGPVPDVISKVQSLTPTAEWLQALVIREVNKLEDWIFTPYYSEFDPSVSGMYNEAKSAEVRSKQVKEDRKYAARLLKILNSGEKAGSYNSALYSTSRIYLQFMTQDYQSCLQAIRNVDRSRLNDEHRNHILRIEALCLTADQPKGEAVILPQITELIMHESKTGNKRFIFAIARELEYNGNTTDAAALYSYVNEKGTERWAEESSNIFWRTVTGIKTLNTDAFDDYFFYLDAQYTAGQMEDLLAKIAQTDSTEFDKWKFKNLRSEKSRLTDLLGTKYMRLDNLNAASAVFARIPKGFWKNEPYATYLNANPFYTNFYNEHTKVAQDKKRYTKLQILQELQKHLSASDNTDEKFRAYHAFIAANAYFNMSFYGNSWLMKRYYASQNEIYEESGLQDDKEYYTCNTAKSLYLKARSLSKNKKFQALCLRMAGRCENYRILHERTVAYKWDSEEADKNPQEVNKYYAQLKKEHPDDYEELMTNCYSFERYFPEAKR